MGIDRGARAQSILKRNATEGDKKQYFGESKKTDTKGEQVRPAIVRKVNPVSDSGAYHGLPPRRHDLHCTGSPSHY